MAHSTDIVGYTFNAGQHCPECIVSVMTGEKEYDEPTEQSLDRLAVSRGIDRYQESEYDSRDFPKVILRDQAHDLYVSGCGQDEHGCNSRCGQCGTVLGGYDTCPALEDE